jgi:D-threonine aldolase
LAVVRLAEVTTPALVAGADALDHNLNTMSRALPGGRLRPHVKAHKCTGLAREQAARGHVGFACATVAEMEGLARCGLGRDLLLANEVLDCSRLRILGEQGARITVAVDSEATIDAAAGAVREVLVDVNVGMPRCGCRPQDAARLAESARGRGLEVRGVMGYEGHVVGLDDRRRRAEQLEIAMTTLARCHEEVGGAVVSGGGTGTYDINGWVTEVQAGSYVLMDSAYAQLDLPFRQAMAVWSTVISASKEWAVCDAGLKSLGMDHGNPDIPGHQVWFCSDEHITFSPPAEVGTKVTVMPAHVDPTVAYHSWLHVVEDPVASESAVLERWPIDLRGW